MAFTFKPKDSSVIQQIRWTGRDLIVTLHSGKSYRYAGVSADLAFEFARAPSAGKFYNAKIKKFPFREE